MKCECDKTGVLSPGMESYYDKVTERPFVTHKPNECKCTNDLKKYNRRNKIICLCSCCVLSEDIEVTLKDIRVGDVVLWDGDYWEVTGINTDKTYALSLEGCEDEYRREDEIIKVFREIKQ